MCLGVRLGLFVAARGWDTRVERHVVLKSDALGYHSLASNLLERGRFSFEKDGPPDTLRTPLYPLFVASIYALAGQRPWVVLLVQIMLDTASCWLLYLVTARILNRRAALLAAGFYALEPFGILYSLTLMSETLFVFLCVAGMYFLAGAVAAAPLRRGARVAAAGGLAFGLAALTRPIAAYIPAIVVIVLLVGLRHRLKAFAARAAAFLCVFVLTLSPWLVRNYVTFGSPGLCTAGDYNLLVLHAAPIVEAETGAGPQKAKTLLLAEADARARADGYDPKTMNPFTRARYRRSLALEYIGANPVELCKRCAAGVAFMFANLGTGPYAELLDWPGGAREFRGRGLGPDAVRRWFGQKTWQQTALGLVIAAYLTGVYLSLAAGLSVAWRHGDRAFLLLCLLVAAYFVVLTGPGGLGRFRLAAMPFYLVFAGIGASRILSRDLVRRLFRIGTLSGSLGMYVTVTAFQKGLGLLRVVILTWMMTTEQYGLWGLGAMLFSIAAPLAALGTSNGLVRYVSVYEARGQLRAFYRKMRWCVPAIALVTIGAAFCASNRITTAVFAAGQEAPAVTWDHQRLICWAALGNALLLALYVNMLSFLRGMRAYRAVSAIEILFGVTFTVLALAVLVVVPAPMAALWTLLAHGAALVISLIAGMLLLHLGLELGDQARGAPEAAPEAIPQAPPGDVIPFSMFRRLVTFGLVSLLGGVLWNINTHISFYLTKINLDTSDAGIYFAFMRLGQPVLLLAEAAWAVLFVHVARRWESRKRAEAVAVLETAYKGISLAVMTIAVVVYAAAPAWVLILKREYQQGLDLVGPMLMNFLVIAYMSLMVIQAKLHERPIVIAVAAVFAGLANAALAVYWIPKYGVIGAAYAAGVGMYVGVGLVSAVYLLTVRPRLHWSSLGILLIPALLLLPRWDAVVVWSFALAVIVLTPLVFDGRQKRMFWRGVRGLARLGGGADE